MLTLVAALQLLSGHAQTAWYTLILAFVWCGYWAWMDADGFGSSQVRQNQVVSRLRATLGAWLFVGASYLLAAALAAIQLIPTAEYLLQSQRQAAVDYELAMTYSLWPWRLLTLLAPSLFGSPVNGDYWGYANYWEDALYIGLFPVLLAMIALVRWLVIRRNPNEPAIPGTQLDPGPRWEAVPLLLVLTGVSLLLAMGRNTPVFPWLYRHVPTFDMFQAPARFSLWAAFSLSLLAGFGAHSLRRPEKRSLYWTRLGTAGAAAVTIGAGIAWIAMGEVSPTFLRATALAGLLGVIVGILCLIAPPRGSPEAIGLWHWSVVAFVAVDLVLAGWMLNPGVSTEFYSRRNDEVESVSKILAGRRLYLSSDDENDLKFKRFFLFSSFESGEDPFQMRRVFLPNLNMLDGIPIVNNFDPLLPGSYAVWVKALNEARGADLEKLLDLSGVGAVESIDPSSPDGVRFSPLPAEKGKRVRLVQCENQGAENNPISQIEYLLSDAFDPGREILLEGDSGEAFTCLGDGSPGKVTPFEELPDRLVYQVQQSSPGWLLLSDSWYPGWQATVDGESRPILRANTLFRAVAIRPGDREVIFEYKPMSLWAGVLISLLTGLSLISFVYVKKREKARKATSPLGLSFPERAEQR